MEQKCGIGKLVPCFGPCLTVVWILAFCETSFRKATAAFAHYHPVLVIKEQSCYRDR